MKKLSAILPVIALALTATATSWAAGGEVSHYSSTGAYASFSSYNNGDSMSLSVYQDGSGQTQSTWLSYYVSSCTYDASSYACTGSTGWGTIPNGDFHISGASGAANLTTNLAGISGVTYSYGCDYATSTCSFTEGPLSITGMASATWSKSTMYSFKNVGHTEVDYLNYKLVSQGETESTSASAVASIAGVPFSGADGSVGTSRGVNLSIVKNH